MLCIWFDGRKLQQCLLLSIVLLPMITGGRSERVCECFQQGSRADRAPDWGFPECQLLPLLLWQAGQLIHSTILWIHLQVCLLLNRSSQRFHSKPAWLILVMPLLLPACFCLPHKVDYTLRCHMQHLSYLTYDQTPICSGQVKRINQAPGGSAVPNYKTCRSPV